MAELGGAVTSAAQTWSSGLADPLKDIQAAAEKIEAIERTSPLQPGDLVSLDQNGKLIKATGHVPIKGVVTEVHFDLVSKTRTAHIMDHAEWIRQNTYRR